MKLVRALVLTYAVAWMGSPVAEPLSASSFPNRVVTLVVPYTANSGSDIIARVIAPRLSSRWKQPVVVDNKPGASGNLGTAAVAKATPDGYTLLMAISTVTMTPSLYKSAAFDLAKDLAPIAELAEAGFALAVGPGVPAKDIASLIDYINKSGGNVNFASPGKGTPQHLGMELFKSRYRLSMQHVPYRGIGGALADVMGGQVQVIFASVHSLLPGVASGRIRLLAVTGAKRNALVPQVPTFREQGVDAMDTVDAWYAVMAPARVPAELIARLNRDFVAVMNTSEVQAELGKLGLTVKISSPRQLGVLIETDLVRWRKVIKDAGLTSEE